MFLKILHNSFFNIKNGILLSLSASAELRFMYSKKVLNQGP